MKKTNRPETNNQTSGGQGSPDPPPPPIGKTQFTFLTSVITITFMSSRIHECKEIRRLLFSLAAGHTPCGPMAKFLCRHIFDTQGVFRNQAFSLTLFILCFFTSLLATDVCFPQHQQVHHLKRRQLGKTSVNDVRS